MKLYFTRAIHNHPSLEIKLEKNTPGFTHENEIPKGFEWEVEPGVKSIKGLKPANKEIVGKLLASKSVIIADDTPESKDAVKALLDEVKAEAKIRDIKPAKTPPAA